MGSITDWRPNTPSPPRWKMQPRLTNGCSPAIPKPVSCWQEIRLAPDSLSRPRSAFETPD